MVVLRGISKKNPVFGLFWIFLKKNEFEIYFAYKWSFYEKNVFFNKNRLRMSILGVSKWRLAKGGVQWTWPFLRPFIIIFQNSIALSLHFRFSEIGKKSQFLSFWFWRFWWNFFIIYRRKCLKSFFFSPNSDLFLRRYGEKSTLTFDDTFGALLRHM